MADEDPWFIEDPNDSAPAAAEAAVADAAVATGQPGDAPADDAPKPTVEDDGHYRKPVVLYKHWVRPQFLQYKYMYDYRTNYYNDVIDYLDKRNKGLNREVPRAQTWAERVLRSHASKSALDSFKYQCREDKHLIQTIASSIKCHNYHTRAYIHRKYSTIL